MSVLQLAEAASSRLQGTAKAAFGNRFHFDASPIGE
jgi:hypothetical protein